MITKSHGSLCGGEEEQSNVSDRGTHCSWVHVGRQKEMLLETENAEAAAGLCTLTHSKSHSHFLVASII